MRRILISTACLLALAGTALSAPRGVPRPYPVDPFEEDILEEAPYGGGFIEMLMTGRDPTDHRRPFRRPPVDPYTGEILSRGPVDPYTGERLAPPRRGGRGAVAALPPSYAFDPETDGVGMEIDPKYQRQVVAYAGPHKPGTIVIHTPSRFLYLVQPGGRAIRYGIGVGRPGFSWAGLKTVSMKREWPDWRPPAEMLKRRPDLPRYMEGGPDNPLGARALYLGSSLYRIHGTNEPHTIGRAVSSGCIRMLNEDVVDLYNRVKVGTQVVVI
ncbi:MAG TPA: L,D-transpeptidase [Microvirga sp.]|jgi:lipoprotein-anchoring transpeptidase ErfK/SrfK